MMLQHEGRDSDSSSLSPINWNDNTLAPYREPFSTLEETNARLSRELTAAEQERDRQLSLMRSRTPGE
jgi:hypothetical protein